MNFLINGGEMKNDDLIDILHIDCDCMDYCHTMRFWYDNEDNMLYNTIHLRPLQPWYKRIWIAIKFIFGKSGDKWNGNFDNWILNRYQVTKLKNYLIKIEEKMKEK